MVGALRRKKENATTASHHCRLSSHQVVGHYDDVLDLAFVGEKRHHVAVATNFRDIRVLDTATLSATSLHGHTDMVLSLTASKDGRLLVSGSKVRR
jgi:U3 small nucleolar RNA-associated protein 13